MSRKRFARAIGPDEDEVMEDLGVIARKIHVHLYWSIEFIYAVTGNNRYGLRSVCGAEARGYELCRVGYVGAETCQACERMCHEDARVLDEDELDQALAMAVLAR